MEVLAADVLDKVELAPDDLLAEQAFVVLLRHMTIGHVLLARFVRLELSGALYALGATIGQPEEHCKFTDYYLMEERGLTCHSFPLRECPP